MKRALFSITLALGLLAVLITPALAQNGSSESPAMTEGLKQFYLGNWDQAITQFTTVMQENPQDTLAFAYILDCYYRKTEVDGIVSKTETEAAAAGESAESLARLGMAYFLKGKIQPTLLDEALTEFKSSIAIDKKNPMAYTGMGLVYFQKRMMPRAKGYFVAGLRLNPHDVMAMDRLGNILLVDEKKPQESKEIFEIVMQELPSYPDGYFFYGSSLYDLKQYQAAIPYLQKSAELDPKGYTQGYDAMNLIGSCYLNLGQTAQAISAFETAKKCRPEATYPDAMIKKAKEGPKATPATDNEKAEEEDNK